MSRPPGPAYGRGVAVTFQRSSGKLARAWAPGAVTCLILLGSATGALGAATVAAPTSSVSSVPRPGSSSELSGISCTSPGDCWAVGDFTSGSGAQLNQALHWNGRKWSLVPTPDPGQMAQRAFDSLVGVRCISASNCWAVGSFASPGNGVFELNQALHWNGRHWSLVPTPDPGGLGNDDSSGLTAIRCPSPASCWAVGVVSTKGQANLNEILHWNGAGWSVG